MYTINTFVSTGSPLGFVKGNDKSFLIQNMILMVFKLHVHKSGLSGTLGFNPFLYQLVKATNLEKGAASNKKKKT